MFISNSCASFLLIIAILFFPANSFAHPVLQTPPAIAIDAIEYELLTDYSSDSTEKPNYNDELVLRYRVKINELRDTVVIDLSPHFEKQGWKVISDSGTKHVIRGRDWTIEEVISKARTNQKLDVKKPFLIQYTVIPEEPLYITRNGYGLLNVPYGGRDYGYKIKNRDEYLEKNKRSKDWDRISPYNPPNRKTIRFDSVGRRLYSNESVFLDSSDKETGQTLKNRDSQVLDLLSERDAFLEWQNEWKQHHPSLDFTQFIFYVEKEIEPKKLQKINRVSLDPFMIISPKGEKAINFWAGVEIINEDSVYKPAFGTSKYIRVFDYLTNTSFQVLFTGNYGPWIRGAAWLDDNLFVAVGEVHDLSGSNDKISPAVLTFDLDKMSIRIFTHEYILASDYHKKRKRPVLYLTEPLLFLDF